MLQGGQNLGEIDDLKYFNNRLARGLRIPSSYLPTGPDDSQVPLSDGRVGTAMIQEYRFNQYCERLQNYIARILSEEFKLFLRWRGFNIDSGLFDLKFNPPQNFASYRQAEIDTARVTTFTTMAALPYMSIRFCMERFLGLSQEEIKENQKLYHEERTEPDADDNKPKGSDLRSIGISTSDIEGDLETSENMPEEGEEALSRIEENFLYESIIKEGLSDRMLRKLAKSGVITGIGMVSSGFLAFASMIKGYIDFKFLAKVHEIIDPYCSAFCGPLSFLVMVLGVLIALGSASVGHRFSKD
jgi:hypothetical protein